MSRDWQAVTSRNPCRICGAKRRCAVTSDGHASKCCYDLGSPGVAATGADEVGDYAIYFSKDATAAFRQNFHASSSVPETPIADVEVRDKVYRELLRVLNLSPEHHDNLARRGLSSEDIEEAGYRTLPSSGHAQIYRKMIGAFGGIVGGRIPDGVPGFHAGKITSSGGMLIPVRNTDGSVVAVKIRTDATTGSDAANTDAAAVDRPKYIWLSSKSRDGASPGMHVHAPFRRAGEDECPEVRVTEGPLKADVATRLSGVYTIGIPGATAVRSILPVLTELGAKRVLLAWDADASKNKHVAGGLELAATILSEAGLEICVETWDVEDDGKPKGIDDALLAETPLALHEGVEAWAKIAEICRAAGRTPSKTTQEKIDASGEDDEDDKDDVGGTMVRLSGVPSGGAPSLPGDRADGVRGPGDGGDHGGGGGAGGDGGGDGDGGDGDGVAPAPATPPDNWQTLFLTDRRGIIRQSYANACNILRYDPKFFGRIRFNSMSQTVMLDNEPLTDIAASEAREWIDREYGVDFGTDMIWSVFARVGNERKFHPVRDYLNSLVWDGVPRLYRVAAEILGAPRKLHAAMVAKTFIAAVERAFYPGCKVEVALVLGGNQGWRKSTFFNVMGMQWFSDTPFDITSKEAYMQIGDCWIVELGEIDRITTKKDAEEIKPFLSSQFDRYVPKYGRSVINRPRGCIFVGTTNREKFLNDPTGERRWLPMTVDPGRMRHQDRSAPDVGPPALGRSGRHLEGVQGAAGDSRAAPLVSDRGGGAGTRRGRRGPPHRRSLGGDGGPLRRGAGAARLHHGGGTERRHRAPQEGPGGDAGEANLCDFAQARLSARQAPAPSQRSAREADVVLASAGEACYVGWVRPDRASGWKRQRPRHLCRADVSTAAAAVRCAWRAGAAE